MNPWFTLAATIGAAVVGGGTTAQLINYFQNRKKLTAEAEDIYSRRRSRERREDLQEKAALKAEAELFEYKVDRLIDACTSMLDQVQHCPGVEVRAVRAEVLQIKYLDRIPGREPPPSAIAFGGSDT